MEDPAAITIAAITSAAPFTLNFIEHLFLQLIKYPGVEGISLSPIRIINHVLIIHYEETQKRHTYYLTGSNNNSNHLLLVAFL